eukprot:TRINITY_DN5290_c0_g2_i1.p1 TRINITY_DN5290_c0_g2~~TRINITY_DN5290_c0_g2_i1.p1  ORF type:complete len:122 (+),score=6.55 TRINITY_DN5290_c0_g2_i1:2-367(+)
MMYHTASLYWGLPLHLSVVGQGQVQLLSVVDQLPPRPHSASLTHHHTPFVAYCFSINYIIGVGIPGGTIKEIGFCLIKKLCQYRWPYWFMSVFPSLPCISSASSPEVAMWSFFLEINVFSP